LGRSPRTIRDQLSIALGLTGLLVLTIQFLMAPTHTIAGVNYADAWRVVMSAVGLALIVGGTRLRLRGAPRAHPAAVRRLAEPSS
jgi:hypothetical protein